MEANPKKVKQSSAQIFLFCIKNNFTKSYQNTRLREVIADLSASTILDINEALLKCTSEIIERHVNSQLICDTTLVEQLKMLVIYMIAKNSVEFLDFDLEFFMEPPETPIKQRKSKIELKKILEAKSVQIKQSLLETLNYPNKTMNVDFAGIFAERENEIQKLLTAKFGSSPSKIPSTTDDSESHLIEAKKDAFNREQKEFIELLLGHTASKNRNKKQKLWTETIKKSKENPPQTMLNPSNAVHKLESVDKKHSQSRQSRANVRELVVNDEEHTYDRNHIENNVEINRGPEKLSKKASSRRLKKAPRKLGDDLAGVEDEDEDEDEKLVTSAESENLSIESDEGYLH